MHFFMYQYKAVLLEEGKLKSWSWCASPRSKWWNWPQHGAMGTCVTLKESRKGRGSGKTACVMAPQAEPLKNVNSHLHINEPSVPSRPSKILMKTSTHKQLIIKRWPLSFSPSSFQSSSCSHSQCNHENQISYTKVITGIGYLQLRVRSHCASGILRPTCSSIRVFIGPSPNWLSPCCLLGS